MKAIKNCSLYLAKAEPKIKALKAQVKDDQATHEECRGKQKVKNITKVTKCNSWKTFSTTLSPPACTKGLPSEPSPTVYECILANANFWPAANVTYAQMQADCSTAIAELDVQKSKCDKD